MNEWTVVTERAGLEITERLQVPGGWLYRTQITPYSEGEPLTVAMAFVPRPEVYASRKAPQ